METTQPRVILQTKATRVLALRTGVYTIERNIPDVLGADSWYRTAVVEGPGGAIEVSREQLRDILSGLHALHGERGAK